MTCPIRNTSPFLGLHARARDAPHQSTDEGRSAPVHGRKKIAWGGDRIRTSDGRTSRLLDRIGPVGRFGENQTHYITLNCTGNVTMIGDIKNKLFYAGVQLVEQLTFEAILETQTQMDMFHTLFSSFFFLISIFSFIPALIILYSCNT